MLAPPSPCVARPTQQVDIEGQDTHCIASLRRLRRSERPPYASVENVTPDHIRLFEGLGYYRFKAVDQGVLHTAAAAHAPELLGHSGPFGAAAPDALTGTHWQPASTLLARLPLPGVNADTGDAAWYDLHAALPRRQVRAYLERRRRRLRGAPAEPPLEHVDAVGPAAAPGAGAAAAAAADEAADNQDADAEAEEGDPSGVPALPLVSPPVGASDGRRAEGGDAAAGDAAATGAPPTAAAAADAAATAVPPAVPLPADAAAAAAAATPDAGEGGSAVGAPEPGDGGAPRGGPPAPVAPAEPTAAASPPPSPPAADEATTGTPLPPVVPAGDAAAGDAAAGGATPAGGGSPAPAAPTLAATAAAVNDPSPSPVSAADGGVARAPAAAVAAGESAAGEATADEVPTR